MTRIGVTFWVLVCLAGAVPAWAQPGTGAVSGVVTASTGLALPGVTVTIRNPAAGLERRVVTQTDGSYVFTGLPVQGAYEIQADLPGFATVVHSGVSLVDGQRLGIDFTLFAATAEALVVTGRVATLEHARSTVQQMIGSALVHALPLVSRDFLAVTSLTAGFTGSAIAPSPEGQIYWSNNVLVDGASHFSKWRGAARTFYSGYGLESIREVQVLTSQFSAEYGEALATVTLAVTNSGTNTLRGSALLFAQDSALNDRPAFTPVKPRFSSLRFGGTTGGPIIKDRTHFFASYEGNRLRGHQVVVSPEAPGALATNDQDEHLLFLKIDHKISRRDLMTVRYNGQWFRWHDEPGGLYLPGSGTAYTNDVHTVFVSDTTLISNRALNQMRFQFARYTDVRRDLDPSLYVARSGYSIQGGILGPYGFGADPEDTWEGADTLSYVTGAHSFKAGGGLKRVGAHTEALPYGNGAYYFGGQPSLFPQPFAFLQGLARSETDASADPRSVSIFGFAQDDWTIGPRLTLNVGLRYDVEAISNVRHYTAATDTNNLQPRLGAAWDAFPGRMVVRGGVGVYTQQHLLGYINKVQLEGADGTSTLTLAPGSPLMPGFPAVLSAATLPVLPPRDIQVVDPGFRNPHSVQGTIGAEHSLFGMVVGTDVVYLRGFDLMSLVDTNAPASIAKPSTRSVAQADLTRPILPVPNGFRKIVSLGNEGRSWYRALQLKVDRSVGRVQAVGSYTFAHANDMANYLLPEDSRTLGAEKGRADNDIRHNLSVGLSWQIPETRPVMKGVTLSAFGLFRSNRPYTITWGDDRFGTSQNDARPGGRNTAKGDGYQSVDLSLAKRFRAMNKNVEARVEAFNLLSTLNYDEYVGVLSSPYFGQPVSASTRRVFQLAGIVRF
jgi:outer membrane receptor protein involved in Fe transport